MPDLAWVDAWGPEPQTQQQLESMGHHFTPRASWGDAQAVRVDPQTGLRSAGCEPRNEGAADGLD